MEALYFETNRLIQDTQSCFQQLNNVSADTSEVENNILRNIAMVNAYVKSVLILWLQFYLPAYDFCNSINIKIDGKFNEKKI